MAEKTYTVTMPAAQADYLLDSAPFWGVGLMASPVTDGRRSLQFGQQTYDTLSALPDDYDGTIVADSMWIAGEDWAILATEPTR